MGRLIGMGNVFMKKAIFKKTILTNVCIFLNVKANEPLDMVTGSFHDRTVVW